MPATDPIPAPRPLPPPSEPAVAPLDVGSLGAVAVQRAIGRTLRRPGFWIAVVAVAALIVWLLRQ
jgi:hypothetical protein